MPKGRTFAAKLAHEASNEGKVICPVCSSEVKKIKLILSRDSKAGTWAPKYDMRDICKCNENNIMNGNV